MIDNVVLSSKMLYQELIDKGGNVMWPLLVLALVSILIIADRIVVLIIFKLSRSNNKPNPLRFVRLLELIAQVSPVLGFLGTVTGIMASFKGMSLSADVTLQTVSAGMYEALYTTAAGLIISLVDAVFCQIFKWSTENNDKKSC